MKHTEPIEIPDFTAEKARHIAKVSEPKTIIDFFGKIMDQAEKGLLSLTIDGYLPDFITRALKERGFEIEVIERDMRKREQPEIPPTTKISWGDE